MVGFFLEPYWPVICWTLDTELHTCSLGSCMKWPGQAKPDQTQDLMCAYALTPLNHMFSVFFLF